MTYATLQDLLALCGERELTQLTDRAEPPSGVLDEDVIDKALADADAEVDAFLGVRYAIPLSTVPAIVTSLAADVARFRLYREPTELVRRRYDDALKLLRDFAKGAARLDVAGAEAAPASPGLVQMNGPDRIFSRDRMRGL